MNAAKNTKNRKKKQASKILVFKRDWESLRQCVNICHE